MPDATEKGSNMEGLCGDRSGSPSELVSRDINAAAASAGRDAYLKLNATKNGRRGRAWGVIFFEIERSRPANSSPETLMLLFLQLRLPSQANRVEERGPEGGCDILQDTRELVRNFRQRSTRSELPNRGWTSVVSDNDANLAKLHPYTGLVVFIMPLMIMLTHVLLG